MVWLDPVVPATTKTSLFSVGNRSRLGISRPPLKLFLHGIDFFLSFIGTDRRIYD
jgi:hypothetical protein